MLMARSTLRSVTSDRWRMQYGGIRTDQARQLKALERENTRLRRLMAELRLDKPC